MPMSQGVVAMFAMLASRRVGDACIPDPARSWAARRGVGVDSPRGDGKRAAPSPAPGEPLDREAMALLLDTFVRPPHLAAGDLP
jgi:hypothetical protein